MDSRLRSTGATVALLVAVTVTGVAVSVRGVLADLGRLAGCLPRRVTLNLYSHVTEGMDRDAADLVAQLLDG